MYSASILIVYEGDSDALDTLMGNPPKTPRVDERAPTTFEVKKSVEEEEDESDKASSDGISDEDSEDEDKQDSKTADGHRARTWP